MLKVTCVIFLQASTNVFAEIMMVLLPAVSLFIIFLQLLCSVKFLLSFFLPFDFFGFFLPSMIIGC